jgi:hypothetical protein
MKSKPFLLLKGRRSTYLLRYKKCVNNAYRGVQWSHKGLGTLPPLCGGGRKNKKVFHSSLEAWSLSHEEQYLEVLEE